jgi:hypothetical protein
MNAKMIMVFAANTTTGLCPDERENALFCRQRRGVARREVGIRPPQHYAVSA